MMYVTVLCSFFKLSCFNCVRVLLVVVMQVDGLAMCDFHIIREAAVCV